MTMKNDRPSAHDPDEALRQAMRSSVSSSLNEGESQALQARILAQWEEACAPAGKAAAASTAAANVVASPGGILSLHGFQQPRMLAMGAVLLAALAFSAWWVWRPEPVMDEDLMHPDVLSLIAVGEM